jgi:O-methyltransferase
MSGSSQPPGARPQEELRDRYLDLLQGSLSHTLYGGADAMPYPPRSRLRRGLLKFMRKRGLVPVRIVEDQAAQQREGRYWPMFAQTMIGLQRLGNLRSSIETILSEGVPGDLIEAGVWRGGASIFMRGVLAAHGVDDRTVWAADSFRGLPRPDAARYPDDAEGRWHDADELAVPLDEVRENFRRYGLLDDRVRFLEGWFSETLPTVRDRSWALVRLDGDMYESTMDGLENLYPGLSPGGFLIVDDFYSIDECRKAVMDFRASQGVGDEIRKIDWNAAYWRRSA